MPDSRPIAIFDSGLGGLTVVHAVRRRLPGESIIYFGDTARVPYGIKSSPTVARYSVQIVRYLAQFDPKAVIVACNTASAVAMDLLCAEFDLPIWDVIEPGSRVAADLARRGPVALLATEATVASGAYPRAIQRHYPGATVLTQAAPLLVPIVEEGRGPGDPVVELVLGEYLAPLRRYGNLAAVLLGCTHYPLLAGAIANLVGPGVDVVDSAEATAAMLADELPARGLDAPPDGPGSLQCLVSDNPDRFRTIGSRFLGEPIEQVQYVSPDDFFPVADHPTVRRQV